MELRVLKYFLAVAEEENITAAAEKLHLTQPTLSKQLMNLEDELGKQLFIRGKRKISLTPEGHFLRQRAAEILELADQTEAEFKTPDELICGDINIGGGETAGIRQIARIMTRLRTKYPLIHFNIFSGNGEDVAERLDKGLIDFGVFIGMTDLKKYDYVKLKAADVWGLLLRRDHPLAQKEYISPPDLLGLPLLFSRQALLQNELAGWLGFSPEKLNLVASYNLLYNASVMVSEGLGAAICIDGLVNTESGSDLCFRPLAPGITADRIVAWKKHRLMSKAAEKFLQELQQSLH
jgi:DNA-binding transcriptional LysR family regulator